MISASNKKCQKGRLGGREAEGSQPASRGHEELNRDPFASHLTFSTSCILSVADVAFEIHLEELKGSSRHLPYRLICKHTFKNFMLLMIPLISCLLRQCRGYLMNLDYSSIRFLPLPQTKYQHSGSDLTHDLGLLETTGEPSSPLLPHQLNQRNEYSQHECVHLAVKAQKIFFHS